jgi:peroxiredoxin
MEGHQRNLYLYERFNARVLGVSRDDVTTLKYFAKNLDLTFPLLSNVTSFLGVSVGAQPEGQPIFSRLTIIVDKKGIIRYANEGSPKFKEVLLFLKKLNQEGGKP